MSYPQRQRFLLIVIVYLLSLSPLPLTAGDWHWNTEARIIAISDIHGAFDEFLSLLKGLHLVDDAGHWTGGADHLVIVGDVVDRGAASREVLALIMQLETEAEQAGGMVHMMLGNHEVMNLVGDLRYVTTDEFAHYTDVEDPEYRNQRLQNFISRNQDGQVDNAALLQRFNRRYPPGFFGHRRMFSQDGAFGKWLLTRPVIITINDTAFVHAGLSQSVAGLSMSKINELHQQVLGDYLSIMAYFVGNGVLDSATNFFDQPGIIRQSLGTMSVEDQGKARRLLKAYNSNIFDASSPTWYRGNVGCSVAIEQYRLGVLLEQFGARRLVIGHTPTSSRTIESRFDGKLIRIDAGMLNSYYRGQPAAAIITAGEITAYYPSRSTNNSITIQARHVGSRPGKLTDTELESVLLRAPINNSLSRQDQATQLGIEFKGHPIKALFSTARSKSRDAVLLPEVAAYRLDRYLGLEMTPVTVLRTVADSKGSITLDLDNLIDENQRVNQKLGGSAWCSLKDQFNMMYVFDILLHNRGRGKNDMHYTPGDMHLILTGNNNTLGTQRGSPKYLKSVAVSLPGYLKSKLQDMNAQMLEQLLGDVLDAKRRKAILARRDLLLKRSQ